MTTTEMAPGPVGDACERASEGLHQFPVLAGDETVDGLNKYMVYFVHRHLEYRLAEVEALATEEADVRLAWSRPHGDLSESPFWYLHLPSDAHVTALAERCLLAKVRGGPESLAEDRSVLLLFRV